MEKLTLVIEGVFFFLLVFLSLYLWLYLKKMRLAKGEIGLELPEWIRVMIKISIIITLTGMVICGVLFVNEVIRYVINK